MGSVRSVALYLFLTLLSLNLAACAGIASKPRVPDDSQLRPAQDMVRTAEAAGAAQLAPDALREAHRRLGVARGLLFHAATEGRSVSKAENRRLERLVEEATVDARLALALTRQEAVERKRSELSDVAADKKETR